MRPLRARLPLDVSELLGPAWSGWILGADGLLYAPEWRRGFTAHELRAMWWRCQQVAALEVAARDARRDAQTAQDEADRLAGVVAYLRRQVTLEARLGAMLGRIAG